MRESPRWRSSSDSSPNPMVVPHHEPADLTQAAPWPHSSLVTSLSPSGEHLALGQEFALPSVNFGGGPGVLETRLSAGALPFPCVFGGGPGVLEVRLSAGALPLPLPLDAGEGAAGGRVGGQPEILAGIREPTS